jgi:ankyrin repeat protein
MGITRSEFLKLAGAAAGFGLLAAKSGGAESKPEGAAPLGTGAPPAPVSMVPAGGTGGIGGETRRFRAAVLAGDLPRVTAFLAEDPALAYSRDERGRSLLALAYLGGQKAAAELLRPHVAALDLVEATLAGDRERVLALLGKAPGLLNEPDPVGFTAVQAAVLAGRTDLLMTMVSRGADFNALSVEPPRRTAVRLAFEPTEAGEAAPPETAEEMADLMLGNGGDPNVPQGDGITPLHAAARLGNAEVIRLLVWAGADTRARTPQGETALDLAVRGGQTAAAALLRGERTLPRAHRTSRYAATADGSPFAPRPQPALPQPVINEYVAVSHGNLARVQELLALYPSLLLVNASWNELAVEAGAHVGFKDGVRLQLDQGAPCALPTAAMMGKVDHVRALLAEDPERIHDCGAHNMPLAWFPAIGGGSPEQLEIARFLLDRGLDVNAHKRGQTALHWAARGGHVEMAELLLARGADVNARAKGGPGETATPLAQARKAEQKDVADLLRRHGGVA